MLEAVLLVGGQGTRLRPLTVTTPKQMLPVAGVPLLTHQITRLRDAGVGHVVMATSYRAEAFSGYFGDGDALGVAITYAFEDEPLGTGGAIGNVSGLLRSGPDDPVVVLNGDNLSGHDLAGQLAQHHRTESDVTLHLVEVEDARAFGCVPCDDEGRVLAFLEKMPEPVTHWVNAGCYVFRRSVVDTIPSGRPVSVERETFPGLLASGGRVSPGGRVPSGPMWAPRRLTCRHQPTSSAALTCRRRLRAALVTRSSTPTPRLRSVRSSTAAARSGRVRSWRPVPRCVDRW